MNFIKVTEHSEEPFVGALITNKFGETHNHSLASLYKLKKYHDDIALDEAIYAVEGQVIEK